MNDSQIDLDHVSALARIELSDTENKNSPETFKPFSDFSKRSTPSTFPRSNPALTRFRFTMFCATTFPPKRFPSKRF